MGSEPLQLCMGYEHDSLNKHTRSGRKQAYYLATSQPQPRGRLHREKTTPSTTNNGFG